MSKNAREKLCIMETQLNAEGASPMLGPKSSLCHLPSLLHVCRNSGNRELPRMVALGKEMGKNTAQIKKLKPSGNHKISARCDFPCI